VTAIPELVIGALIAGKYRVESILGRGGMGAVYLATNEDLGRRVAIKVLLQQFAQDEALLKRFRQEARTAAAIGHPGIVDVLDLGQTEDGSPFIVMEALEGETLGARIVRERRLSCDDTVHLVAQALDALAAAHDKGVLHRDLKPDNLFVVSRPVPGVKILDFGISKLAGTDDVALTQTGMVFGTPLYMAPEQARGAKYAGPPSDVYAIGAILFHALTGRTPFTGETYNEVLEKLFTQPAPSVSAYRGDVPPALSALIDRMLAKEATDRPASAHEAQAALLAISQHLKTMAPIQDGGVAATMPPTLAPTPKTLGMPRPEVAAAVRGSIADERPTVKSLDPRAETPTDIMGVTQLPTEARGAAPAMADVPPVASAPVIGTGVPAASAPAIVPAGPPSRVLWFVGGGVVLVGGFVLAALALTRTQDRPAAPIGSDQPIVAVSRDAAVIAEVVRPVVVDAAVVPTSVPGDAAGDVALHLVATGTIQWSGQGVACSPGDRCVVRGAAGTRVVVTAQAAGFQHRDLELVFDRERDVAVKLVPLPTHAGIDAGVLARPPADAKPGGLEIDPNNPLQP